MYNICNICNTHIYLEKKKNAWGVSSEFFAVLPPSSKTFGKRSKNVAKTSENVRKTSTKRRETSTKTFEKRCKNATKTSRSSLECKMWEEIAFKYQFVDSKRQKTCKKRRKETCVKRVKNVRKTSKEKNVRNVWTRPENTLQKTSTKRPGMFLKLRMIYAYIYT